MIMIHFDRARGVMEKGSRRCPLNQCTRTRGESPLKNLRTWPAIMPWKHYRFEFKLSTSSVCLALQKSPREGQENKEETLPEVGDTLLVHPVESRIVPHLTFSMANDPSLPEVKASRNIRSTRRSLK